MSVKKRYLQVVTTTSGKADAERIAGALLKERLAACVQIAGPVTSLYWWKGSLEASEEWLCFIKTGADQYAALEKAIRKVHPYEVPEIVALPITAGSRDYLEWLRGELRPGPRGKNLKQKK
ncbi:MAG TPA: divalent-cation tolerance protein CutA [Syntrophales bacterium]|nr:divalent-cation tolerance protein CutA [Syntrophales bacterium]HOX94529.1 divalent-cation tolerance protein CutA [Syntrophales bacterium]HPI58191.1 divalent-cation tolerance protein CutA [Syntrophales bacterium]HPN26029.1 divalent-cation tolerance protein CutA [Syntrophales bacterium]HQM30318.1 divalent-cation tolerance protein CutA [Syntrophales bacterium]